MAKKRDKEQAKRVTLVHKTKGTKVTVAERMATRMQGYTRVGTAPAGEPSESWTIAQLREWAAAGEVDLAGATNKTDILDAIEHSGE